MPKTRNEHRQPPSRARGFTILELMITLALAAIVLAVAVPSFNDLIVGNRLTTQANEMVGAINTARSEAIKRNSNVSFCRAEDADADECVDEAGAWEFWIVRAASGTIVQRGVINVHNGSIAVNSELDLDQVVFGSDGLARTGGAVVNDDAITVCASNRATDNIRQIVLGAGSRLSTQVDTGDC